MRFENRGFSLTFEIENVKVFVELHGDFFDFEFGSQFRVHNHNSFEFHAAMQGSVEFQTESGTYSLDKSDIFIIAPYVIHSCVRGVERTVKTSFCFSFSKTNKKSASDVYTLFSQAFSSIKSVKKIENSKRYVDIVEKILIEFYSESRLSDTKLKLYFSLLLLGIAEELGPPESKPQLASRKNVEYVTERDISRIIIEEYINRNYNKDISLRDLADVLHLCEKQTSRILQKEFGLSFRQFVAKIRCSAAVYLLTNTDMSVADIAFKVGYQTYNGFYNMFFKRMGESPEQYRISSTETRDSRN